VTKRKHDHEGNTIGRANDNPILDSREYNVQFDDGGVSELTANMIAESMYTMCDENGDLILLFDSIIDHKKHDNAMTRTGQKFVDSREKQQYKRLTKGWDVCVQWKNGTTIWEKLSDFKECYPVQTAEYAVTIDIYTEPAFNYWVPHTLKKCDSIISLVKKRQTRYMKKTHKFGVEVPKIAKEATELDQRNGDTKWTDSISKEMTNVRVVFDILKEGVRAPIGQKQIKYHLIFDVKMKDFRRKVQLVAGGHMTNTPKCMTYSSVAGRETVRVALTIAALNNLQVKSGDVMNAYVTAHCSEDIWWEELGIWEVSILLEWIHTSRMPRAQDTVLQLAHALYAPLRAHLRPSSLLGVPCYQGLPTLLATTRLSLGYLSATSRLPIGYLLATSWLPLGYHLAITWLSLGYHLAIT